MIKRHFKNLGVGVGLRSTHFPHFIESAPQSVQWVELISENFMRWQNGVLPARPARNLELIRKNRPVVLHGVSMSIGSADPLSFDYLRRLKELIDRVEPSHVSDHLCWTGVDRENLHDLLPLPYTREAIENTAGKILQVQDFLQRRILIENVSSYVEFSNSEMTEWEFLREIITRADCGVLLDINNVYVSSVNHGFDPKDYLRAIPVERVGQIHLAGHSVEKDGLLIDTHDEPVCEEVWALYDWYVCKYGFISSMIERDDNIPEWQELEKEVLRIAESKKLERRNDAPGITATL